jgi:hypothetical protein
MWGITVYHRTRLVASAALIVFPLAALISHVSHAPIYVYVVLEKIVTSLAWSLSLILTIMEDRRLVLSSWVTRSFWILQWIKIVKVLESSLLDYFTEVRLMFVTLHDMTNSSQLTPPILFEMHVCVDGIKFLSGYFDYHISIVL